MRYLFVDLLINHLIMKYLSLLLLSSSLILFSCKDNNEPEQKNASDQLLSSITSPSSVEEYSYDDLNRVVKWSYSGGSFRYAAEYDFSSKDIIIINASETYMIGNEIVEDSKYEESVYLDSERKAKYAEGVWTYSNTNISGLKKKYRNSFEFDSSNELVLFECEEWYIDRSDNPMITTIKFEWENSLIKSCVRSYGSSESSRIINYKYTNINNSVNNPITYPVVLKSYYIALYLNGRLGKLPRLLVAEKDINDIYQNEHCIYKYTYSIDADGFVNEYRQEAQYLNHSDIISNDAYQVLWKPSTK